MCSTGEKLQKKQNVPGTETLAGGVRGAGTVGPMDSDRSGYLVTPGCWGKAMFSHSDIPSAHDSFTEMNTNMYRRHSFVLLKILTKRRIIKNMKTALDCVQKLKPKKDLHI